MFDFVIYKMDKYFTEIQQWLTDVFTFTNGNIKLDDKYMLIDNENENDADDLWLLE